MLAVDAANGTRTLLDHLHAERELTMVVVTHDHAFAKRAATWVVELTGGKVSRQGPAADVLV